MNFTQVFESNGWKNFMAKLYGIGAAVVIIGALFKIQHWAGAGYMLTVGLGTEAIIFFFSAFEPLHEEDDWSLVFPQLGGLGDDDEVIKPTYPTPTVGGGGPSAIEKFDKLLENAEINPGMFDKLGEGLNSLSKTTASLGDMTDATVATTEYADNVKVAAETVTKLTDVYQQSTESVSESAADLSEAYSKAANNVSGSGENFADVLNKSSESLTEIIDQSGNDFASTIAKAGDDFAVSYGQLADSMNIDFSSVTEGNKTYVDHLDSLNKNLSALNAVHELELQSTNDRLQTSQELYDGIEEMMGSMKNTLGEAHRYNENLENLNQKLNALNNVYGGMLNAMNVNSNI